MEIKKMGVLSLAKIYTVIMAIFGLILGAIFTIISLMVSSAANVEGLGGYGVASIIILPIFYGVIGFVSGALGAWIYNVAAKTIGGVQIELAEVAEPVKKEETPMESSAEETGRPEQE